jgi:hypothetical protein
LIPLEGDFNIWVTNKFRRYNKLIVKQILLGHDAVKDEYNVVGVEAVTGPHNDLIEIPVAVLKVGEQQEVTPLLEFAQDPVTFRLIHGGGPIYINCLYYPLDYV